MNRPKRTKVPKKTEQPPAKKQKIKAPKKIKQPLIKKCPELKNCHRVIIKLILFDKIEYRIVDWIKWWEKWLLAAVEKYDSLKIELDKDIPKDTQVWEDDADIDYWPECLERLLAFHKQLDMTKVEYEHLPVIEITLGVEWDAWATEEHNRLYLEKEYPDGTTFVIGHL